MHPDRICKIRTEWSGRAREALNSGKKVGCDAPTSYVYRVKALAGVVMKI